MIIKPVAAVPSAHLLGRERAGIAVVVVAENNCYAVHFRVVDKTRCVLVAVVEFLYLREKHYLTRHFFKIRVNVLFYQPVLCADNIFKQCDVFFKRSLSHYRSITFAAHTHSYHVLKGSIALQAVLPETGYSLAVRYEVPGGTPRLYAYRAHDERCS